MQQLLSIRVTQILDVFVMKTKILGKMDVYDGHQ